MENCSMALRSVHWKKLLKSLTKKLPHSHISVDYRHGNENIPDAKQLPCNWENAHDQSLCDILRTLCRKVHFILKIVEREKKGVKMISSMPIILVYSWALQCLSYYNRGEKSYTISCSFDSIWKFTHLQFLILLIAIGKFHMSKALLFKATTSLRTCFILLHIRYIITTGPIHFKRFAFILHLSSKFHHSL